MMMLSFSVLVCVHLKKIIETETLLSTMIKFLLLAFLLMAASEAWLIPPPSASRLQLVRTHPTAVVALDMTSMESASDFSSAMPAKPPLQEQLLQSARAYCESMRASLAD